jgi:hypothetical protein
MTVHSFKCERCIGTTLAHSHRHAWWEYIVTPPPLVGYYRCTNCKQRYPAIGFGENRTVIKKATADIVRATALVMLGMGAIAAFIGLISMIRVTQ